MNNQTNNYRYQNPGESKYTYNYSELYDTIELEDDFNDDYDGATELEDDFDDDFDDIAEIYDNRRRYRNADESNRTDFKNSFDKNSVNSCVISKNWSIVFLTVITLLFVIPGFVTIFKPSYVPKEGVPEKPALFGRNINMESNATELDIMEGKRQLNLSFPKDFDVYFEKSFGLRKQLLNTQAKLRYSIFHESSTDSVVAGKNGWLYLAETVDDYTGEESMDERDIFRAARTIELMEEYTGQFGQTMVFFCAPNKNSVYPEYMPPTIPKSKSLSNLDRLTERMCGSEAYIDMKSALIEYRGQCKYDIYHKGDSHWNNLGAIKAFDLIEENLNARVSETIDYVYFTIPSDPETIPFDGDLNESLFPDDSSTDIQYELEIPQNYVPDQPIDDPMIQIIQTTCQGRDYSAICYRDSFFNALIDPVANSFHKTYFTRKRPYDLCFAVNNEYNIVIIELVERNLYTLLEEAPVAFAPKREAPEQSDQVSVSSQICSLQNDNEKIVISGSLNERLTPQTEDSVYIELRGETGSYFYEAYPILKNEPFSDNGFSAMIQKTSLSDDTYSVFVHVGNNVHTNYAELEMHQYTGN